MGTSGNFWQLQQGVCGECTQLLFQALSTGEQEVIIIIKFMAESMTACTAHIQHTTNGFTFLTVS